MSRACLKATEENETALQPPPRNQEHRNVCVRVGLIQPQDQSKFLSNGTQSNKTIDKNTLTLFYKKLGFWVEAQTSEIFADLSLINFLIAS